MSGLRSRGTHGFVSALILASCVAFVSGCSDPRPTASRGADGGAGGGSKACTLCHGDATRQATATNPMLPSAPPKGTNGESDVTARAVGAHQLHLQGGAIGPAVACAECHIVPTTAAHANGKVDLAFGTLATTGGAVPTWNGSSCSASYCHGGFAGGSSTNAPVWTQARAASCGTCHGLPPAAPHPDVGVTSNCGTCHTGYTATTVNLATHVDGKVDVANMSLHLLPRRSGPRRHDAEPPQLRRAAHGLEGRVRHDHPRGGRPRPPPQGRQRHRLHRVPRRPHQQHPLERLGRDRLRDRRPDGRRHAGLERRDLLQRLLPRRLPRRQRRLHADLDQPGRLELRHLPRRAALRAPHPERRLRLVPHRLHLDLRQRLDPRERQGGRRRDVLHLLPRRRDPGRHRAQSRSRRRAAQGHHGQQRHHLRRRRRPPGPPERGLAAQRHGLHRVPRHPWPGHAPQRRPRPRLGPARARPAAPSPPSTRPASPAPTTATAPPSVEPPTTARSGPAGAWK